MAVASDACTFHPDYLGRIMPNKTHLTHTATLDYTLQVVDFTRIATQPKALLQEDFAKIPCKPHMTQCKTETWKLSNTTAHTVTKYFVMYNSCLAHHMEKFQPLL
jgi:hypothetical protein